MLPYAKEVERRRPGGWSIYLNAMKASPSSVYTIAISPAATAVDQHTI